MCSVGRFPFARQRRYAAQISASTSSLIFFSTGSAGMGMRRLSGGGFAPPLVAPTSDSIRSRASNLGLGLSAQSITTNMAQPATSRVAVILLNSILLAANLAATRVGPAPEPRPTRQPVNFIVTFSSHHVDGSVMGDQHESGGRTGAIQGRGGQDHNRAQPRGRTGA